jgi:hypothetical protein
MDADDINALDDAALARAWHNPGVSAKAWPASPEAVSVAALVEPMSAAIRSMYDLVDIGDATPQIDELLTRYPGVELAAPQSDQLSHLLSACTLVGAAQGMRYQLERIAGMPGAMLVVVTDAQAVETQGDDEFMQAYELSRDLGKLLLASDLGIPSGGDWPEAQHEVASFGGYADLARAAAQAAWGDVQPTRELPVYEGYELGRMGAAHMSATMRERLSVANFAYSGDQGLGPLDEMLSCQLLLGAELGRRMLLQRAAEAMPTLVAQAAKGKGTDIDDEHVTLQLAQHLPTLITGS